MHPQKSQLIAICQLYNSVMSGVSVEREEKQTNDPATNAVPN